MNTLNLNIQYKIFVDKVDLSSNHNQNNGRLLEYLNAKNIHYDYVPDKGGTGKVSKNICKPNVRFHRVAMETWKPFGEYCNEADPPIPLEDWEKTPESVKKFVLESYYVDHVHGDTSNACVDDLRYCTPPRNSNYRKGKSGGPK